jgi:hypothetical protein
VVDRPIYKEMRRLGSRSLMIRLERREIANLIKPGGASAAADMAGSRPTTDARAGMGRVARAPRDSLLPRARDRQTVNADDVDAVGEDPAPDAPHSRRPPSGARKQADKRRPVQKLVVTVVARRSGPVARRLWAASVAGPPT